MIERYSWDSNPGISDVHTQLSYPPDFRTILSPRPNIIYPHLSVFPEYFRPDLASGGV